MYVKYWVFLQLCFRGRGGGAIEDRMMEYAALVESQRILEPNKAIEKILKKKIQPRKLDVENSK